MALVWRAKPLTLAPGDPVTLAQPTEAVVVASGVVALADGTQLRRGALLGPYGEGKPVAVASARTPARAWTLPAVSGLPLLLGAAASTASTGGAAPAFGAHPPAAYPPLASPPGPPEPVDGDPDRRFERKLWWLLLLLLLLALLVTGGNLCRTTRSTCGPATWCRCPSGRVRG
jgi:putative peptide zinc metalloprotease protein